MPVQVAEYLGQSVNSQTRIIPHRVGNNIPSCPFTHLPCIKLNKKKNATEPVCSIAVHDRVFPVCENRVLPSLKISPSPVNRSLLAEIALCLFPESSHRDLRYGLQKTIQISEKLQGGSSKRDLIRLDYVLANINPDYSGIRKCVLEVQAGGETSSTASISEHVRNWASAEKPENSTLAKTITGPGIIPNNAWKRTLEQVFRKAPLCKKFNGGFAIALGSINYEYFLRFIRDGREYYPEWEVALVEMCDNWPSENQVNFSPQRSVFMSYSELVKSVTQYPYGETIKSPFEVEMNQF